MATNHTTNYALNLWEANDKFVREEFNENTSKIEAALVNHDVALAAETAARTSAVNTINTTLANKIGVIGGTYNGDGTERRFINLGVTPKAVILFESSGRTYEFSAYVGGLALPGTTEGACQITTNGFYVFHISSSGKGTWSNISSYTYHYLAFV